MLALLITAMAATTPLFEQNAQFSCGHQFLEPDHTGLQMLASHWCLTADESAQASTWLCSALIAASPNLEEIIAQTSSAPLQAWVQQLGTFDMASADLRPHLDTSIEMAILALIDSLDLLLMAGLLRVVPWLKQQSRRDTLRRLVCGCTLTLLQRGRSVVTGLAAYALGRTSCAVLCSLATDQHLLDAGVSQTLFSVVNLLSPTIARHFARTVAPFSTRRDANNRLHANAFLTDRMANGWIELSALLPPWCPNSNSAPNLLSTTHPESIPMRLLMARFVMFVETWPVHWTNSNCSPKKTLEYASRTGHSDAADAVQGGAAVAKEQNVPCEAVHPLVGSLACLCSASSQGIDLATLHEVVLPGEDGLELSLSPASLNLAWLLAQPAAAHAAARDQVYMLAQVISRVSGDLSGRLTGSMQLLDRQQSGRQDVHMADFYAQYSATFQQPNYSKRARKE